MVKYLGTNEELELSKKNFKTINSKSVYEIEESLTKKVKSLGFEPNNVEVNFIYSEVEFPDEVVKGIRIIEYTFNHNENEYMLKIMYSDGAWLWNLNNSDADILYDINDIDELF